MKALFIALAVVVSIQSYADTRGGREEVVVRDRSYFEEQRFVQLYEELRGLPLLDQREQMWGLGSQTKSALWEHNIDRYLFDHPELSAEAQEVLRDGIRLVTTPEWFDIVPGASGYEAKKNALEALKLHAKDVLPGEAIVAVFIRLGPEPDGFSETVLPTGAEPSVHGMVPRVDGFQCSCGGTFDCGSSSSYSCYPAYCFPAFHCGFYSDELCWGRCKSNEPGG